MYRCRSIKPFRRPASVLGATCTTLFVGALIINNFFLNNAASCISSCSQYLSHERLQKNEASKKVKHPVIRSFDVNYLGSNSPIEDRFVTGVSPGLGIGLFSVIDGHKGSRCSHFIQNHLLQYVTSELFTKVGESNKSDFKISMAMNQSTQDPEPSLAWLTDSVESIPFSVTEQCLTSSFNSLEEYISNKALNDAKLILQGHSMTPEMKENILQAIEGACVTLAMVQKDSISVATTGDCRVVIGREEIDHSWKAIPLSMDQNSMNTLEVERVRKAHPGEENTIIYNGRVLGSLMPFRTFGDVDFKWESKYLESLVPVWPNYITPPYITAEPVITHHRRIGNDRFMVIASDGLWERISNEKVVEVVAKTIELERNHKNSFSFLNVFGKGGSTNCCQQNAATQLLWHALGGSEETVSKLLDVAPGYSRMVRDDITIIVVFFN